MKKIYAIGILLILTLSMTVLATTEKQCNKILSKQNIIQEKILVLESNFPMTAKQTKLHDKLIIKANNLYEKYLTCQLRLKT